MTDSLVVSDLRVSYGNREVLKGISFDLPVGSLTCLLGPNGAGKSTLLRAISGRQAIDSGQVMLGSKRLDRPVTEARDCVALTPQTLRLIDFLTCDEAFELAARLHGVSTEDRDTFVEHWLVRCDLTSFRKQLVREMSGGSQRKLAVGLSLIRRPRVLLLDESFTGLDPESTDVLQEEIQAFCNGGGTVVLCTHMLDRAERIGDHYVIIREGQLTRQISRSELKSELSVTNENLPQWYRGLNLRRR